MGKAAILEEDVLYTLEDTAKELITKEGYVPYVVSRDGHPETCPLDPNGVFLTIEDGKVVKATKKL